MQLNETCPGDGGLIGYCERARRLLADSYEGVNSLQGWTPGIPVGKALQPGSASYAELEGLGAPELGSCGFVLVAGGLGERLGYRDIKLKLPTDLCSGTCYLELYCKQILALEAKHGSGRKVPLAIMVSDDTQEGTVSLLQKQGFFGLDPLQVHFMKQNKVPSILDNDGRIALQPGDLYKIMTKPHGHGDIHSLMHETGTAKKWLDAGVKWVVFLQDTNGLAMHTLAATIGVSVKLGLDMNSLAIPRKAKQAVGGIVKLKHTETGREMTINVEYNQLDSLTGSGFDQGDTNDPSTGFSPYPGNINQLVFALKVREPPPPPARCLFF
jgi:UDP-sugar pyrophosphorylase